MMALFRRSNSERKPPTEKVPADPQAFAPIPPPAPYKPAIYFPADLPQDHLAVQNEWASEYGNESDTSPVRRRRYAKDTEYLRDLSTAAQDGIGHTTPEYHTGVIQGQTLDLRQFGVDPNIGKRPDSMVRNPDKFTYFRPYEQDVARQWDESKHPRIHPDILRDREVRQGNYANRQWRLTARFDPTSGETYDRTPAAADSRVTVYNASSSIRRSFRK